jgi:acetyltransferase-like isoleucine patch superfamily enzyme
MINPFDNSSEDVFSLVSDAFNKLHSMWLALTYPFASLGSNVSLHRSCDLARSVARWIAIGNSVQLRKDVWVNIPIVPSTDAPVIILEDGCKIGCRSVISAKNRVSLGRGTILAPSVLIMDHNHAFEDVTAPIGEQGATEGGTIRIEEGCWIGFGAAIVCGQGELVIGRNSVVGANAMVSRSVPAYSVVTGNPARVVKHYDHEQHKWVLGSGSGPAEPPSTMPAHNEVETALHYASQISRS